jgi:tetratricopeptide (TPR) repeat protein/tRNA A-37 threonylcarbamoyl transferase component Bud32
MSSELLREQLQDTLGEGYRLERELGGGGMSRIFLATETALGRRVVVKVLPPDFAAAVSAERFRREIQLAARLQHPHIVPLLSAGESGGLLYYTMPFVEGESLRVRLARDGALSVEQVVRVLRDVADALAYAHECGVAHRDVKPDNVLLSRGHALVADFGVAKALSAAATSPASVTATSVTVGTPLYMAPEQIAADPQTDHRADIYALGVVAYELLAGRPPFGGASPQALFAAHMIQSPEPLGHHRPGVPARLERLVMRCLEKRPADRPQSAGEVVRELEAVTSSGAGSPTMPAILLAGRGMFRKALAWYAVAFAAVALLARAALVGIGLPDWVFPGALVVMLLGLPVILFTGYVHHATRRVLTTTPTLTPGGTPVQQPTLASIAVKASPHVTWKRTALVGAAALAAFTLLTAAWMITRALGIGPAASLMTAGVLGERERILVADFKSPASDTGLGPVVTEAFRTDLAQSRNLDVVQPNTLREVLRRMQQPPDARVDYALAREVAAREGIKAVVDGEVLQLGGSYVIAAKLISAQSGDVLGTFRATAEDSNGIIVALGKLSREMRAKVGESLKEIRTAPPLSRVTTPSLEALRKYVQGVRAFSEGRGFDKGVTLLEEAIALDTSFAMAYRKLSVELGNTGQFVARAAELSKKAYDHRDRLSEAERYLTIASYYWTGPEADLQKVVAAYEQLIDIQPHNWAALTNLAVAYHELRQFAKAEANYLRAIQLSGEPLVNAHTGLMGVHLQLRRWAEAERAIEQIEKALPASPSPSYWRVALSYVRGQYDSTEARIQDLYRTRGGERDVRIWTANNLAAMARLRGRLAEAHRWAAQVRSDASARGVSTAALTEALGAALMEAWYKGNGKRALQVVDDALEAHPLDRIPAVERPYGMLAFIYSTAGRPDRARAALTAFDRSRVAFKRTSDDQQRHTMAGHIALAERRYADAVREYRAADEGLCIVCPLPNIARAHDLAGEADSAIAVFTRYVETPDAYRRPTDATFLAGTYKRLGELWEAKGDQAKAVTYYAKFVELWKDADPELQPRVAEVRRRLARVQSTAGL